MDAAYISAFAALAGSAIGGFTSLATSWLSQQSQGKAQRLAEDMSKRQDLYKHFIEEASKFYADALVSNKAEVSSLIGLYAMTSRMRILSTPNVIESADRVMRAIVDTYLAPNRTFKELHDMMDSPAIDPLRAFAELNCGRSDTFSA